MLAEVLPGVWRGFRRTGIDMADSRKIVPFAEISIVLSKYGVGTAGLAHSSGRLQSGRGIDEILVLNPFSITVKIALK